MPALELPTRNVLLRAGSAALGAWLVALIVLVPLSALFVLRDAGANWDTGVARTTSFLALNLVSALSLAFAAGVGVWQAAGAGAQSRSEAMIGGAFAPLIVAVLATVALTTWTVGGVFASLAGILALAFGAFAGALVVARHLDG